MSDADDTEKSHEPTPQKLEKAREKGEIARSADVSVAASYIGLLVAMVAFGEKSLNHLGTVLTTLLEQSDIMADPLFSGAGGPFAGSLLTQVIVTMGPWFALPGLAVVLAIASQRAFIVTPSKLKMKLSRVSMISNAGNKYGRSGLFEFAKSFAKLAIFSTCLGLLLTQRFDAIGATLWGNAQAVAMTLAKLGVEFIAIVAIIAAAIGAIDFLWQRAEHTRKNRMSMKDLKDEHKESEGDPIVKQQRRRRAMELANNQMMAAVPDADVVIVNPTHFAVALKWSRESGSAPVCVAKGVDHVALAIRRLAQENGVPVQSDPPTARALYATTELGSEIAFEHFRPVAAAIRFAESMRKRAAGPTR